MSTRKRPASARAAARPGTDLAPPRLDPGAVEAVGVVRAAIDAVRALPGVARAREAASTAEEREELARTVGSLARLAASTWSASM